MPSLAGGGGLLQGDRSFRSPAIVRIQSYASYDVDQSTHRSGGSAEGAGRGLRRRRQRPNQPDGASAGGERGKQHHRVSDRGISTRVGVRVALVPPERDDVARSEKPFL